MKRVLTKILAAAVLLGGISFANNASAQRGGGGDRGEEFRQQMMERMRDRFEVKDDAEWKIISERIGKVMELRRPPGGRGAFFGRGGGPGGPGGRDRGGDNNADNDGRRRGGDRGRPPGGPADEASEALQAALESNASSDEIKKKLAAVRSAREADRVKLEKAQAELREVLSLKQEAQAVLMGFLP